MPKHALIGSLLLALLLLGGCDTAGDDEALVVGSYAETEFSTSVGGKPVNVKAGGGDVIMTLSADGTVSGRVLVPEGVPFNYKNSVNERYDMPFSGTYRRAAEDVVALSLSQDFFLRNAVLGFSNDTLRTSVDPVQIILTKQD